ncbi:hypothetical protein LPJ79_003424 [Coemansia sp. RSA 1821]|nr:hypothetical protein LPJ79_003424 [Coemansia sp. RSA 1821]
MMNPRSFIYLSVFVCMIAVGMSAPADPPQTGLALPGGGETALGWLDRLLSPIPIVGPLTKVLGISPPPQQPQQPSPQQRKAPARPPVRRPVGPQRRPVGPQRPVPQRRPAGPQRPAVPQRRPVGPQRPVPQRRPVGPQRPQPRIPQGRVPGIPQQHQRVPSGIPGGIPNSSPLSALGMGNMPKLF